MLLVWLIFQPGYDYFRGLTKEAGAYADFSNNISLKCEICGSYIVLDHLKTTLKPGILAYSIPHMPNYPKQRYRSARI